MFYITEDETFSEEVGIVAGWGRTREKGKPSTILREVEVPIMTNEVGIIIEPSFNPRNAKVCCFCMLGMPDRYSLHGKRDFRENDVCWICGWQT